MQRRSERILTSHVGSLVRPPELLPFLAAKRDGAALDARAYETCLAATIAQAVRRQRAIGIDIVNDGEFGKAISWSRYILERLANVERREGDPKDRSFPQSVHGKDRRDFAEFYAEYDPTQGLSGLSGWVVFGPISYRGQAAIAEDIARLKTGLAAAKAEDGFMTAVAPSSVAPERKDEYYKSDEDYMRAVAQALRVEYRAIIAAGLTLQIDDAYLASSYDLIVPPGTMADFRKWAAVRVEILNHALEGIPEERTRYHLCWGSWNGPHVSDVPLRDIVDLVLKIRVGGYSLEMANPRHEHEWRVWEHVKLPAGKYLLPGVISHATNIVEHPELVAERIARLARLVGRENVVASTDCGFAQGPFARRVHPTIMWAKLEALVEGARLASKELWH
jgi:5-methyltetrahydropteroyltriglutamate--homocysteine methyltransferase